MFIQANKVNEKKVSLDSAMYLAIMATRERNMAPGEHLSLCKLCGGPETPLHPSDKWEPRGTPKMVEGRQNYYCIIQFLQWQVTYPISHFYHFLAHGSSSGYLPSAFIARPCYSHQNILRWLIFIADRHGQERRVT